MRHSPNRLCAGAAEGAAAIAMLGAAAHAFRAALADMNRRAAPCRDGLEWQGAIEKIAQKCWQIAILLMAFAFAEG
ncbi:hypothetical protein LRS11_08385 [Pseudomonas sp. J452]|uniref:hypothetical protein n=1 Tax=Pseudomonas sp. J452 TaxID=2898441 RepID=UPI0021AD5F87|nr:hypothetical protein [Pseudomonas sp. J452]UUY10031.1 hypothetical protein LRS11_08385 [Pseudomonas sp. J452]